jgi:HEAT repeat protein
MQAIRLLQFVEDRRTARALINILLHDPDQLVRAEAARELGKFILYGELDKLPGDITNIITDALLNAANDEKNKADLRRYALESLGYSGRVEVETLIESSFRRDDPLWKASALVAMGRSSNPERWADTVISMLLDEDVRIREEAARASGELDLKDARQLLVNMLAEDEEDDDVIHAAIWSLSQIGGEDVRTSRAEEDELVDFITEALDNLTFNEELQEFELLAYDDLDELDTLEDLDDNEVEADEEDENEESKPKSKKKKK